MCGTCPERSGGGNDTPPANSLLGRTTAAGQEVLCTNPAALGGGAGKLSPVYATALFAPSVIGAEANLALAGLPRPKTPWGLHLVDANIALSNLADLVRHQIALYERR